MSPTPHTTAAVPPLTLPQRDAPPVIRTWQRGPGLPWTLAAVFVAMALLPRVSGNPRLLWSFIGVAAFLAAWTAVLALKARGLPQCFKVEFARPIKQHYIQSTVQSLVYVYWGWYWREVYAQLPLFIAQLLFLYAFDALLSWSRGRSWRLGFGPFPIILSTNLFLWFKDDWFVFQFLLVAVGALGKEFVTWRRDGRLTHIFNPSAFTLSIFSIVLLATGNTDKTFGIEIATTIFRPPYIYLEIFLLGLVVQYFFAVTLMTFAAAAALCLLNLVYTAYTGVYFFVDTNIAAAVFLGMHLLVTDPSTSPRTNVGKVIFGAGYGLLIATLFWFLGSIGSPSFYDKLLPVPLLNLCVPLIDRVARSGFLGRFTHWELRFAPRKANLVHMGCWAALFTTMLGTGFVEAPHEGGTIAFWKRAFDEGKPGAGRELVTMLERRKLQDDPAAFNAMGGLLMDGRVLPRDPAAAASHFARACELGSSRGCVNVVKLYLSDGQLESQASLGLAFERLEQECGQPGEGRGDG
ncbi:MAG TPA: RnfABCDGE type electron transport complex subunit D [Planctomycetota bacterium]|nr:RnfABCDGE type electron transport complex subunit D [Planctomycetota bacterium]